MDTMIGGNIDVVEEGSGYTGTERERERERDSEMFFLSSAFTEINLE